MIIDAHTHIAAPYGGISAEYFGTKIGSMFTAEDLIRSMDRFNVDISVTFPLVPIDWLPGWMPMNKIVAEAQKKHPDRIIGYCWINPKPGRTQKAIEEVETCIKEWGLKGVKLGPRYDGYFCNDPRLDEFYEKVSELKVPIIYHSGPTGVNSPVAICNVADKFPKLNLIVAHIAVWWEKLTETAWLMKKYKNVYTETSGAVSVISVQRAVEELGADHVMYGTDAPYIEIETEMKRVELANITSEEKKWVFAGTISKLLGLEAKKEVKE